MEDNGTHGVASLDWQDLCRAPLDIALDQNISCGPELQTLMAHSPFKDFFMSMGALCCPWASATRGPIQSAKKPCAALTLPYVLYMKFDHNSSYILL